jgi:hypothetical protein
VRLVGCVLLELVVGASLLAGAGLGVLHGSRELREVIGAAHASQSVPARRGARPPVPYPDRPPAALETSPGSGYFLGVKDEILLAPLAEAPVTRVRFNRGGSSVSLRIDFAGGARAAFKPDQINEWSVPRREIAAYRVSRVLGLEAVAPAVGRRFALVELIEKLDPSSREMAGRIAAEVIVAEDGTVAGELSWWIPVIVDARLDGDLIDSPEGISAWRRYLAAGAPEPYSARHLLPQISNMVVFDYLINNPDRFSGSNTKASPDGRTLFFMDNTLSFGTVLEGSPKVRAALERVQKFSRALARRVKELDEAALREALRVDEADPYPRLLADEEIAAVLHRRERLLAYWEALSAEHGATQVFVYP